MRINFDELFTVEGQIITPKVRINILSAIRGGPEICMLNNTINGVDPITWQGKDLQVDVTGSGDTLEYYIWGLANTGL
ncbi:hypothetical protein F5984_21900 [Rudanella paleaurantiibacter]|uniref:Uncharacterized protein n=1 Tax=Rudanella paleaurantiibacter TaxID=2614655 RepID=A0A7J5TTR5_9BACT|nr:hypothetical protein [Rudanella paleaurantiibacter]KAB7727284.1 hypothetical protein F5984_21900 [Rudanella paleaurantiibacter]